MNKIKNIVSKTVNFQEETVASQAEDKTEDEEGDNEHVEETEEYTHQAWKNISSIYTYFLVGTPCMLWFNFVPTKHNSNGMEILTLVYLFKAFIELF